MALRRKRHWFEVQWEGEIYLICDFPGGILISMTGWKPQRWWRQHPFQFVPGLRIDHTTTPLTLEVRVGGSR